MPVAPGASAARTHPGPCRGAPASTTTADGRCARRSRVVRTACSASPSSACFARSRPFPGGVDLAGVEDVAGESWRRDESPLRPASPASRLLPAGHRCRGRAATRLLFTVHAFLLDARRRGRARPAEDQFLARLVLRRGEIAAGVVGLRRPRRPRLRPSFDNLRRPRRRRAHRRHDVRSRSPSTRGGRASRDLRELWFRAYGWSRRRGSPTPRPPRMLGAAARPHRLGVTSSSPSGSSQRRSPSPEPDTSRRRRSLSGLLRCRVRRPLPPRLRPRE